MYWTSGDEDAPTVDAIGAVSDFHSASRSGRASLGLLQKSLTRLEDDDAVVLSDVAEVSLREEEGQSVSAIAADLGLTPAMVMTDLAIASVIVHPLAR